MAISYLSNYVLLAGGSSLAGVSEREDAWIRSVAYACMYLHLIKLIVIIYTSLLHT